MIERMIEKNSMLAHLTSSDEKFNYRRIEEYINNKEKLTEDTLKMIENIRELDKVYNSFKKELQAMKKNELNRLAREFLIDDYERRYGVTKQRLISTICGEDFTNAELNRQVREEKVIIL
jgi:hypothetical protein